MPYAQLFSRVKLVNIRRWAHLPWTEAWHAQARDDCVHPCEWHDDDGNDCRNDASAHRRNGNDDKRRHTREHPVVPRELDKSDTTAIASWGHIRLLGRALCLGSMKMNVCRHSRASRNACGTSFPIDIAYVSTSGSNARDASEKPRTRRIRRQLRPMDDCRAHEQRYGNLQH